MGFGGLLGCFFVFLGYAFVWVWWFLGVVLVFVGLPRVLPLLENQGNLQVACLFCGSFEERVFFTG